MFGREREEERREGERERGERLIFHFLVEKDYNSEDWKIIYPGVWNSIRAICLGGIMHHLLKGISREINWNRSSWDLTQQCNVAYEYYKQWLNTLYQNRAY